MEEEQANEFLKELSSRSSLELLEQIEKGKLEIETLE